MSEAPVVTLGVPAKKLDSGTGHACVITETDAVRCWGSYLDGNLGYATTEDIGDDESVAGWGDLPIFPELQ